MVYDINGREAAESEPLIKALKPSLEQYIYCSSAGGQWGGAWGRREGWARGGVGSRRHCCTCVKSRVRAARDGTVGNGAADVQAACGASRGRVTVIDALRPCLLMQRMASNPQ